MIRQYINDWHMTVLAFIVAFAYYFARKRKYAVTWFELIAVSVILAIGGTIGGSIASLVTQGTLGGRRAYGIILIDTLLLFPFCALHKSTDGRLTDYAAIPAAAIVLIGKTQCWLEGCCYGITLANGYQFPCQFFEWIMLAAIWVWLMILEKKGNAAGFLWSLHVMWYGITRYIADLFRGDEFERAPYFFLVPAGQFWSLIIVLVGLALLNSAYKKRYHKALQNTDLLKAMIGNYPPN